MYPQLQNFSNAHVRLVRKHKSAKSETICGCRKTEAGLYQIDLAGAEQGSCREANAGPRSKHAHVLSKLSKLSKLERDSGPLTKILIPFDLLLPSCFLGSWSSCASCFYYLSVLPFFHSHTNWPVRRSCSATSSWYWNGSFRSRAQHIGSGICNT